MKPLKVEFTDSDANNNPRRASKSVIVSWISWFLFISCIVLSLLLILLRVLPQILMAQDKILSASDPEVPFEPINNENWKANHRSILILAQGRSGSSFLGEIFNQHPDVFYLYEPLHAYQIFSMTGIFPEGSYSVTVLQVLFDIFNCHFSSLQDYLTFISFPELSSPHFRLASKPLSAPPFCKATARQETYTKLSAKQYREFCPKLRFREVSKACYKKRYTVVKDLVHRLPFENATSLERLLNLQPDLHLVYLVRDPRAVVISMKSMGWIGDGSESKFQDTESAANYVCKQTLDILWKIDRWSFPYGARVHLLRYEDLASNSVQRTKELFKAIDITFPESVKNWITKNTNTNQSNKIEPYQVNHRNASVSLNAWKSTIKNKELIVIQKHCSAVMAILKYNSFDDVLYLRDPVMPSFREFSY